MKKLFNSWNRPANVIVVLGLFSSFSFDSFAQATDVGPVLANPGQTPTAFESPETVMKYQSTITPDELAAHLYFFASDFFEGRETTAYGQKLAAHYLASQYRKMNVQPKGTMKPDNPMDPSAYFQPFDVYGNRVTSANLTVIQNGSTVVSSTNAPGDTDDQSYLVFGSQPEIRGEVIFAGYGIEDDDLGYNDFKALETAGISAEDKWLLILPDEPLKSTEESLLPTENGGPSAWTTSMFRKLSAAAQSVGPAGILVVVDASVRFDGTVAEAAARAAANREVSVGSLSLEPRSGGGRRSFPPVFAVSTDFANQILHSSGRNILELKSDIDNSLQPVVLAIDGVEITSTISQEQFEAGTENVVAFIEGSDPELKHEYVIISSHYDHIGKRDAGDGDGINNGADDDGSGTVALLEIAEAFMAAQKDGVGPRRSIMFLSVSGEEKGLLGSAYYADSEPIVPLENTVTNLNIDMIGRLDPTHPGEGPDYVYIIGSNLISQELHDINQRINSLTGIHLDLNERFNSKDDPNRFYRRSDHWNFGKHGIPFIFFFTGTHEDYHGVEDHPEKIEYDRMARIGQLIFATAWQVANQLERPVVTGTGFN